MKLALHAIRLDDYRLRWRLPSARGGPAGIWFLDKDMPSPREAATQGPAIILVPSEPVLVTAVDLPLPSRRQRIAALPFAIEDRIAEPVESVHVALGAEAEAGRYLAAVVARATMAEWVAQAEAAGLGHAVLMPDALALPRPAEGAWSVERRGERVLVRVADGTGFALAAARFAAMWQAAGRPECIQYGDALPDGIASVAAEMPAGSLAERLRVPPLDLRQGPYARARGGLSHLWRRAALVAGCGLLAHGLIAGADVLALQRIADARKAETRALVERIAPGTSAQGDLAELAGNLLPARGAPGAARFVPLMGRVSEALGPGATLRSVAYDAGAGTATLEVGAADLAALQAVEARLRAAGLDATGGGGNAAAGGAEGQIIIRTGGGA